jgi:hypothetical protein
MSEKIYALLLRLYPAGFRARYTDVAMELLRERAHDETGLLRRLRFCLDLLRDLATSLPRAYIYAQPEMACAGPRLEESPAFQVLQSASLRGSSIVYAVIISLATFGSFFVWVGQVRYHRMLMMLAYQPEHMVKAPPTTVADLRYQIVAKSETGTSGLMNAKISRSAPPASSHADSGNSPSGRVALTTARPGFNEMQAAPPDVQDATKAMVEAIGAHQIVMFGETHADKQEYQWLCKLVKTPGFADRVDDIVVEFGNSLYQKSVDRYIAGEDVPFEQVQKAWRNVIGAVGPVSPVYGWFYQAVRDSNLHRPRGHKIRLLLGDPYGDWEKIVDAEGLGPYLSHRDQWYAQVVNDEVLARNHHALLIMGEGHFLRRSGPGEVERAIRAAGVRPYLVVFGTNVVGGYDDLDPRFDAWQVPAIVPLSDGWVGDLAAMPVVTGGIAAPNSLKMSDVSDAMLYLGPRASLTAVNVPRSELVGTAYGKELARRFMIQTGRTLEFDQESEVPQFQKPLSQTSSNGNHSLPSRPPKSINDPLPPRPPSQ